MKVLVTGGLGFQGTHLTKELLARGYKVFTLNTPSLDSQRNLDWLNETVAEAHKKNLVVLWSSITDEQTLARIVPQVDVIFHLAAKINVDESIENPNVFYETNIKGTASILRFALPKKTRVIYASTCEVYGAGEDLDEQSILNPQSPYAASKAGADRLVYAYSRTYGLPVDIVRPFNVYGPLQKDGQGGAVVAIFLRKILANEPLMVHGDGKQARDFIYVGDLVNGYLGVLDNKNEGTCNIYSFGSGVATNINQIIAGLESATGIPANVTHSTDRKGQVSSFTAKKSIKDYFGAKEPVNINEGLRMTYEFRKKYSKFFD